jgi:hypothetical protein
MHVKWKLVLVSLEIVLVSAQDWCIVCAKCGTGMETILTHPMVLQGDLVQVKLVSLRLGIVFISMQDSWTVCAECTMGMETILGTLNGTHR